MLLESLYIGMITLENSLTLSTMTKDAHTLELSSSVPDIYPRENPVHVCQNTQVRMLIAELFLRAPICNNLYIHVQAQKIETMWIIEHCKATGHATAIFIMLRESS